MGFFEIIREDSLCDPGFYPTRTFGVLGAGGYQSGFGFSFGFGNFAFGFRLLLSKSYDHLGQVHYLLCHGYVMR